MTFVLESLIVGLALLVVGFVGRQFVWPQVRALSRRLRQSRRCEEVLKALAGELEENLSRLDQVAIGTMETREDGTSRVIYHFGSAYSSKPVPALPALRRFAMDDGVNNNRVCLSNKISLLDDAVSAVNRYESIDHERFRDAWRGAMNPQIERMVLGDPGHATNRANSSFVIEVDKEVQRTRSALSRSRSELLAK